MSEDEEERIQAAKGQAAKKALQQKSNKCELSIGNKIMIGGTVILAVVNIITAISNWNKNN